MIVAENTYCIFLYCFKHPVLRHWSEPPSPSSLFSFIFSFLFSWVNCRSFLIFFFFKFICTLIQQMSVPPFHVRTIAIIFLKTYGEEHRPDIHWIDSLINHSLSFVRMNKFTGFCLNKSFLSRFYKSAFYEAEKSPEMRKALSPSINSASPLICCLFWVAGVAKMWLVSWHKLCACRTF